MSRGARCVRRRREGFPRVSGDEPTDVVAPLIVAVFSPRERG